MSLQLRKGLFSGGKRLVCVVISFFKGQLFVGELTHFFLGCGFAFKTETFPERSQLIFFFRFCCQTDVVALAGVVERLLQLILYALHGGEIFFESFQFFGFGLLGSYPVVQKVKVSYCFLQFIRKECVCVFGDAVSQQFGNLAFEVDQGCFEHSFQLSALNALFLCFGAGVLGSLFCFFELVLGGSAEGCRSRIGMVKRSADGTGQVVFKLAGENSRLSIKISAVFFVVAVGSGFCKLRQRCVFGLFIY